MPIQLTAAYDPGDRDSGTYAEVNIVRADLDMRVPRIRVLAHYGNTVSSVFEYGKESKSFDIEDSVDDATGYTDFAALLSNASESAEDAFVRCVCQWLLDKGHFVGTIV